VQAERADIPGRLPSPCPARAPAARFGSCRKAPGAVYVGSGKEWVTSLPFVVRCGRTSSSRSGDAPRPRRATLPRHARPTRITPQAGRLLPIASPARRCSSA
jgi:hypothetical protein